MRARLRGGAHLPVLLQRPDAWACTATALTVQDLGATFGGAGQFTVNTRAKVHLSSWAGTPMFAQRSLRDRRGTAAPPCRGNIAISSSAGPDGDGRPIISDVARRFLHERLSGLTPAHIRALFETARLDELGEDQEWRDRASRRTLTGIDAWVAAFQAKVDGSANDARRDGRPIDAACPGGDRTWRAQVGVVRRALPSPGRPRRPPIRRPRRILRHLHALRCPNCSPMTSC